MGSNELRAWPRAGRTQLGLISPAPAVRCRSAAVVGWAAAGRPGWDFWSACRALILALPSAKLPDVACKLSSNRLRRRRCPRLRPSRRDCFGRRLSRLPHPRLARPRRRPLRSCRPAFPHGNSCPPCPMPDRRHSSGRSCCARSSTVPT